MRKLAELALRCRVELDRLVADQEGNALTENAIWLVVMALGLIAAATALREAVAGAFNDATSQLKGLK